MSENNKVYVGCCMVVLSPDGTKTLISKRKKSKPKQIYCWWWVWKVVTQGALNWNQLVYELNGWHQLGKDIIAAKEKVC